MDGPVTQEHQGPPAAYEVGGRLQAYYKIIKYYQLSLRPSLQKHTILPFFLPISSQIISCWIKMQMI